MKHPDVFAKLNIEKDTPVGIVNRNYSIGPVDDNCIIPLEKRVTKRSIIFVDGGHASVISGKFFSLSIIRLCSVKYYLNRREEMVIDEYWCYTSVVVDKKPRYKCEIYDKNNNLCNEFYFDCYSHELAPSASMVEIETVVSHVRRLLEIGFIRTQKAQQGDILILDGSLRTKTPEEKEMVKKTAAHCEGSGVLLLAVAKSSSYLTDQGLSLDYYLLNRFRQGRWFLNQPVISETDSHKARIYFCKLHKNSDYVLAHEISYGFTNLDLNKIFGAIALNSRDPTVLGYPYGLVVADRFARVSNKELFYYKNKLLNSPDGKRLAELMNLNDLHSVLDSVS